MLLEQDNNLIDEMDKLISDIDNEIKQTTQAVVLLKNNSGVRLDELRSEHENLEQNYQQLTDRFNLLESEHKEVKCALLKYEYFIRKMIEKIQDLRNSVADIRQQLGEQHAISSPEPVTPTAPIVSVAPAPIVDEEPEEAVATPVADEDLEEAVAALIADEEPEEAVATPVVDEDLEEAVAALIADDDEPSDSEESYILESIDSGENLITIDEIDELDPIEVLTSAAEPIDEDPLDDALDLLEEDLNGLEELIHSEEVVESEVEPSIP